MDSENLYQIDCEKHAKGHTHPNDNVLLGSDGVIQDVTQGEHDQCSAYSNSALINATSTISAPLDGSIIGEKGHAASESYNGKTEGDLYSSSSVISQCEQDEILDGESCIGRSEHPTEAHKSAVKGTVEFPSLDRSDSPAEAGSTSSSITVASRADLLISDVSQSALSRSLTSPDEADTSDLSQSSTETSVNITVKAGEDICVVHPSLSNRGQSNMAVEPESYIKNSAHTMFLQSQDQNSKDQAMLKTKKSSESDPLSQPTVISVDSNTSHFYMDTGSMHSRTSVSTSKDSNVSVTHTEVIALPSISGTAEFEGNQLPAIHNFFPEANFSRYNGFMEKPDCFESSACDGFVEQPVLHDSSGYISGVSTVKEHSAPKVVHWAESLHPNDQISAQCPLSNESSFNSCDISDSTFSGQEMLAVCPTTNQGDQNKSRQGSTELFQQDQILMEINETDRRDLVEFMSDVTVCSDTTDAGPGLQSGVQSAQKQSKQNTQPMSGNMIHLQHWQSMPMNSVVLGDSASHPPSQMVNTNFQGVKNCLPNPPHFPAMPHEVIPEVKELTNNRQVSYINHQAQPNHDQGKTHFLQVNNSKVPVFSPIDQQVVTFDNCQGQFVVQNVYGEVPGQNKQFVQSAAVEYGEPFLETFQLDANQSLQPSITISKHPGQRTVDYIDSLLITCDASNYRNTVQTIRPRKEKKVREGRRIKANIDTETVDQAQTQEQELEFIKSYQSQRRKGLGRTNFKRSAGKSTSVGIQCSEENIDETSRLLKEYCAEAFSVGSSPVDTAWEASDCMVGDFNNNNTDTTVNYYQGGACENFLKPNIGEQLASSERQASTPIGMQFAQQMARAGQNTIVKYSEQLIDCERLDIEGLPLKETFAKSKMPVPSFDHLSSGDGKELRCPALSSHTEAIINGDLGDYTLHNNDYIKDGACGDSAELVEHCDENPLPKALGTDQFKRLSSESPLIRMVSNGKDPLLKMQIQSLGPNELQTLPSQSPGVRIVSYGNDPLLKMQIQSLGPDELQTLPSQSPGVRIVSNGNDPLLKMQIQSLGPEEVQTLPPESAVVRIVSNGNSVDPSLEKQILYEATAIQSPGVKENMASDLVAGTLTPTVDIFNTPELTNKSSMRAPGSVSTSVVPETPLQIDESRATNENEEEACEAGHEEANKSSVDITEYEEEHRFEDEAYVNSFIKAFRTNPRRYKVYPEASLFRKTPLRPKKYTKSTKGPQKLLPQPQDQVGDTHLEGNLEDVQKKPVSRPGRCTRATRSEGQHVSELLKYINGLNGQVKKLNRPTEEHAKPRKTKSVYVRQRSKPLDLSNKPKKSRAKRKVKAVSSETSVSTRSSTGSSGVSTSENSPPSRGSTKGKPCPPALSPEEEDRSPVQLQRRKPASRATLLSGKPRAAKLASKRPIKRKRCDADRPSNVKQRRVTVSKRKITILENPTKSTKSVTNKGLKRPSESRSVRKMSSRVTVDTSSPTSSSSSSSSSDSSAQNTPLDLTVQRKLTSPLTEEEEYPELCTSQSERFTQRKRNPQTISCRKHGRGSAVSATNKKPRRDFQSDTARAKFTRKQMTWYLGKNGILLPGLLRVAMRLQCGGDVGTEEVAARPKPKRGRPRGRPRNRTSVSEQGTCGKPSVTGKQSTRSSGRTLK